MADTKANYEPGDGKAKKMPKGGAKGGARFPQLNLAKALDYSKKLVAKTHTGPLAASLILPGVFGRSDGQGKVRASALKQYGLLEGPSDAYKATALAKSIDAAIPEELPGFLKQALMKPHIFSQLVATYQNDNVSKAKVEQRVKGLQVHPDSAAQCTRIFIESAVTCGIGVLDGENLTLGPSIPVPDESSEEDQDEPSARGGDSASKKVDANEKSGESSLPPATTIKKAAADTHGSTGNEGTKSQVTLTLNVDSSSDPDRLEKQLRLLQQFGMI